MFVLGSRKQPLYLYEVVVFHLLLMFVLGLISCFLGEFLACSLKDESMVEDHGHRKPGKLSECQTQTTGTNENFNEYINPFSYIQVLFLLQ